MCIRHAGSSSSRPVVALVGDSTARSLDVGIMALSATYDWTYVAAAQNGCSLIDRRPVDGTTPPNDRCPIENVAVRSQLLDYRPTLIIAMDRNLTTDFISESGQRVAAGSALHLSATELGLAAAAAALTARGATLVLIETLPPGLPLDCAERAGTSTSCSELASSDRLSAEYGRIIESVAARHPDVMRAVSITSLVCPRDSCSPEVEGTILRYDRVHFTKSGARWLAPHLYDLLEAAGLRDRLS